MVVTAKLLEQLSLPQEEAKRDGAKEVGGEIIEAGIDKNCLLIEFIESKQLCGIPSRVFC